MAARKPPTENISPDQQTLNAMPDSSTEEGYNSEPSDNTIEDEVDYSEEDLKELEQNVPYNRFKEVNEKAKVYKSQLSAVEKAYEEKLKDLTRTYEARLSARQTQDDDDYGIEYDDPSTKHVQTLQKQIEQLNNQIGSLQSSQENARKEATIGKLTSKYPNADVLAVKGWHMVYPEASLEDLMEKSHNDNMSRVKNSLNDIIQRKKTKAKAKVPMGRSPLVISEEERPKTLKEATSRARAFLSGL